MTTLAFLDIEATSADPKTAQIIEIGLVIKNEEGKIVDHFNSLINPAGKIPPDIVELTGITDKMTLNSPEFHEVAEKVYQKLVGTRIVAHKVEFDFEILKNSFNRLGKEFSNKTICTLKLAKNLAPEMSSYSLASLCAFFGIPLKKNHRAMEDAEAVAHLFENLSLLSHHVEKSSPKFLAKHKKMIEEARAIPGFVTYKDSKNKTLIERPVENIQKDLSYSLRLSPKNRRLVTHCEVVKVIECASFAKAMLLSANKGKDPKWSIYSFKNPHGEIIIKCGKVLKNKKALFYFDEKKQALRVLKKLKSTSEKNKYVYQEGPRHDKDEIVKRNRQLQDEIRKLKPSIENTLFKSKSKIDGKFQYVVVKGADRYATFKSNNDEDQLEFDGLRYKKLSPSSRRALELSMQYIKNQKNKTDIVMKIKQPF